MEWYYYLIIVAVVLFIGLWMAEQLIEKKKIYQLLLDNQEKNGLERYEIVESKNKNYDYILKNENVHLYLRVLSVPSNAQICINAKETWVLNSGGNKNNKGRVYPNHQYLNELIPFLKNDITNDDKALKVVLVYKSVESIVRYLNESELDNIDITKTPHCYKVMQYATFKEELDYILQGK